MGVLERFIGVDITATHIIREDVNVKKSVENQRPFVEDKKHIQPSLVMYRIAQFITKEREEKKPISFIEKLKKFLGIG